MTTVFHKLKNDRLDDVLAHGLLLASSIGSHSEEIDMTDNFLNKLIPSSLRQKGLDRKTNIYCYMTANDRAVDIKTGDKKSPQGIIDSPQQSILRIEVDPKSCYVSDLDLYDKILELLQDSNEAEAKNLARMYWQKIQSLSDYSQDITRPEVMVTYDIPPACITKQA
jgi:hypothetical protein